MHNNFVHMFKEASIMFTTDLGEIIFSLSKALDLSAHGIAYHHHCVALISSAIADRLIMTDSERDVIFLSALVHDAGVINKDELEDLIKFEDINPYQHCQKGYDIFSKSKFLKNIAKVLLYHHDRFNGDNVSGLIGNEIPLNSSIIYLADRVAVLIETGNGYILHRYKEIRNVISRNSRKAFNPKVVDAFMAVSNSKNFWLDLQSEFKTAIVNQKKPIIKIDLTSKQLVDIAVSFSKIIDQKSPYTYNHSNGVALVADYLADKFLFSNNERTLIKVAGYLHDLGKISITNEILDKPCKLTDEEFTIIKKHPLYSYQLLQGIPGFELISQWGSYHHEMLNGLGYPFGLKGEQITLGARIMAVSDIFIALTEDRPYRKGLDCKQCLAILKEACERGEIDINVVTQVELNYDELLLIIKGNPLK